MPLGSNLTGLICAYVMRIEIMDMKLGTHNFSEDLSGFIRGYGSFCAMPPDSNLTGLISAYAD